MNNQTPHCLDLRLLRRNRTQPRKAHQRLQEPIVTFSKCAIYLQPKDKA